MKKVFRKFIILAIALVMVFSLGIFAGCSSEERPEETPVGFELVVKYVGQLEPKPVEAIVTTLEEWNALDIGLHRELPELAGIDGQVFDDNALIVFAFTLESGGLSDKRNPAD